MKRRSDLEATLDDVFSDFIRLRDADMNGTIRCYCCNYPTFWKSAHNGHFFGRTNRGTRWNELNCHSCCPVCNTSLSGNLEAYEEHLIRDYGESIIDRLTMLKNTVTKFAEYELKDMIDFYREKVKILRKEKGL